MRRDRNQIRFPLNWTFISVPLSVVVVADFGLPFFLTASAISAARTGEPFKYFDSWETLILADVSLILLGGFLLLRLAQNILTQFTSEGLWQRRLFGWKFIAWNQVTLVRVVGLFMHVHSAKQRIVFAWAIYKDFRQVASFVRKRVPANTFPQASS